MPFTGPNGRTVDVLTVWQFDRLPDSVQYADAPRLVTLYLPWSWCGKNLGQAHPSPVTRSPRWRS